jgi:TolA-binding protein
MPTSTVDSRLSRLETIIDNISQSIEKISARLDNQGKVNWAPIAIAVTVFFTVAGSISTIYNARITTINTAVESLAKSTYELEKSTIERGLRIQTNEQKTTRLQTDIEKLDDRVSTLERFNLPTKPADQHQRQPEE